METARGGPFTIGWVLQSRGVVSSIPVTGQHIQPRKGRRQKMWDNCNIVLLLLYGVLIALIAFVGGANGMPKARKIELREEVRSMFHHGWDNYMQHAFPADEIKPISCIQNQRTRSPEPLNLGLNDVLGNFSLTAIDTLSTLGIFGSSNEEDKLRFWIAVEAIRKEFYGDEVDSDSWANDRARIKSRKQIKAYKRGERRKGFDIDSRVHVFETTIRVLGGLLSGHLYAIGEFGAVYPPPEKLTSVWRRSEESITPSYLTNRTWTAAKTYKYTSHLLDLAHDLGERLLPAFTQSSSGIPFPRINLRYGLQLAVPPMNCQSSDMDAGGNCHYQYAREGKYSQQSPYFFQRPYELCGKYTPGQENEHCWEKEESADEPDTILSTNPAGAGSLVLEMALLSRLTGDGRFEEVAKKAYHAVWKLRSGMGLLGSTVWVQKEVGGDAAVEGFAGIGAGLDSFYEYALKSYIFFSPAPFPSFTHEPHPDPRAANPKFHQRIPLSKYFASNKPSPDSPILFSPEYFLQIWRSSHSAVTRHIRRDNPVVHYLNVNAATGATALSWIDSLSAYWPGNLVTSGDITEAQSSYLLYAALWSRYSALPERWNVRTHTTDLAWWPGRPEFIESTYFLYQATKDPWYLYVGEMVLKDIQRRCWAQCGWAGLQEVTTGEQQDRMESFFLGETLQYLFLLFDEENELNKRDEPWVFTTEGHPVRIPNSTYAHKNSTRINDTPKTAYNSEKPPLCENPRHRSLLSRISLAEAISPISARADLFHSSYFTRLYHVPPTLSPTRITNPSASKDQGEIYKSSSYAGPSLDVAHFPWTFPKELLPLDGVCSLFLESEGFELRFPVLNSKGMAKSSRKNKAEKEKAILSSHTSRPGVGETKQIIQVEGGIRIASMEGLRIGLTVDKSLLRINKVNNLLLGRNEIIFLERRAVEGLWDQSFELVYDPDLADIVVELVGEASNGSGTSGGKHKLNNIHGGLVRENENDDPIIRQETEREGAERSDEKLMCKDPALAFSEEDLQHLIDFVLEEGKVSKEQIFERDNERAGGFSQLINKPLEAQNDKNDRQKLRPRELMEIIGDTKWKRPKDDEGQKQLPASKESSKSTLHQFTIRKTFPATFATGLGSLPITSFVTDRLPAPDSKIIDKQNHKHPPQSLSYTTFNFASYSCSPDPHGYSTVMYEVMFLLRGQCLFSTKITSVPDSSTTKLIVVIDEHPSGRIPLGNEKLGDYEWPAYDENELTKPLIDEAQTDQWGNRRKNDVGMVMIGGGIGIYEGLSRWLRRLEVRRRWHVNVRGMRLQNVIIV